MTAQLARDPRRWWGLIALALSALVIGFDTTILNIALPTLAKDLGADTSQQQWIIDAFMVSFAAFMLPAGLLGDRFGRRALLMAGLALFLAGALVGMESGSPGPVIGARVLMGLGAALIMPLAMAMLPVMFSDNERSKAVGLLGTAMALGVPLGPMVGGWLLDHFWWGSVFLINVPLVGAGLVACLLLLPESSDPATPRVDPVSTALSAGGLVALVYAIIEAPRDGWSDPLVVGLLAASVVLIAGLTLRSRQLDRPMLDLALLRQRAFLWNTIALTLGSLVFMGLLFVLPQYLQSVLGNDSFGTGLRLTPMMVGLLFAGGLSHRIVPRFGARPVITAGMLVLAAAAVLGSRTSPEDGYGATVLWLTIAGFGFGFAMLPAMDAAIATLPEGRSGTGSGLIQTLRQVGGALGVALLGSMLSSTYTHDLDTRALPEAAAGVARESVVAAHLVAGEIGDPGLAAAANSAYISGMNVVLVVCGVGAMVAAALTATLLPSHRGGTVATGLTHERKSAV